MRVTSFFLLFFLLFNTTYSAEVPPLPSQSLQFSSQIDTYDQVVKLLDYLEQTPDHLVDQTKVRQLNQFLAFLASSGNADQQEIVSFLQEDQGLWFGKLQLCSSSKSWLKKTKKFVKKHKKEILIGATVIIASGFIIGGIYYATTQTVVNCAAISALSEEVKQKVKEAPKDSSASDVEKIRIAGASVALEKTKADPDLAQTQDAINRMYGIDYYHVGSKAHDFSYESMKHGMFGDLAVRQKRYTEAKRVLDLAVTVDPDRAENYLNRGISNYKLGNLQEAKSDYNQFLQKADSGLINALSFGKGFAYGLPQGLKSSGEETALLAYQAINHPIDTSIQMFHGFSHLAQLAANGELNELAETLSPEVYELITTWDEITPEERGRLAGFAVGKEGGMIFLPKGVSASARSFSKACKKANALGRLVEKSDKLYRISNPKTAATAIKMEEASTRALERTLAEHQTVMHDVSRAHSRVRIGRIENKIEVLKKNCESKNIRLSESQIKRYLRRNGVQTFPKPRGIPNHWKAKFSDRGCGMIYYDPKNSDTHVRVMPGKPHSPHKMQKKPYISWQIDNIILNSKGTKASTLEQQHIPIKEFKFLYIEHK